VRALALFLLAAALAGCPRSSGQATPGDDAVAPPEDGCVVDADCIGAGASCCGCPEYAVSVVSDWAQACEDIQCPVPDPGTCSGAVPRCDLGTCVLGCAPVACDQTCETGFAVDAAGCLSCECAAPIQAECAASTDCVEVPADCCGCATGGTDTAIPVELVAAHTAGLDCPANPVCPGVDVCTPGVAPRCTASGTCVLDGGIDPGTPVGACGTPDLPPCPVGQTCTLNSDDGATTQGVGVCL